jgi:iron(III) transport system substrate-binding protein
MKRGALVGAILVTVLLAWASVSRRSAGALVVYCAHDLEFAQPILNSFSRDTGIKVVVVGDTEATKSLGLVQRLILEKDHPRCDVFWNNQLGGTLQLQQAGLLQPYQGTGYRRMSERFKDPEGCWVGFAGRLRVWIVNTQHMAANPPELEHRLEGEDLSKMAMANPLFGTTLSHFSVLWKEWGPEELKAWHARLKERGCKLVPGNASVKNLVAEGVCDFGWTDTDDYFVARDDGFPVAQLPIRVGGATLCSPNTISIIKGTRRLALAERLVDYLLSREVELQLARSASRQIPLGPVNPEQVPNDVRPLVEWASQSLDMRNYAQARAECLEWLKQESAP